MDEIDKKKKLDEDAIGFTGFGGGPRRNTWYSPTGRMARFFSKFFATKAQPYVVGEFEDEDPEVSKKRKPHPLAGDTVSNVDVLAPDRNSGGGALVRGSLPQMTQLEVERRRRYTEFENMDDYPEIAAAFDIYADDSTQRDTKDRRWVIKSDDDLVKDELEKLFSNIKFDRYYWDIVRNTVKYGDCFTESIVNLENPKAGIQRIKILNPNYLYRVENEYGYLTDFLQEIPQKNDWAAYGFGADGMKGKQYITLDRNQISHFRLHTSDPTFYPYGKSIAANARQIHRSLKLMEDAMLIYRLSRAPERRIFYIDVGNLPTSKAMAHIEETMKRFKKEKFYNSNTHQIDSRYNPLSADEDFFFPMKKGSSTKVDTLQGAQNLGEVDDVKYFRDKLLSILKIPKDFIVEKDQAPERKANLAQLDVKFAKVITRVQRCIEIGMESIAKRHLQIKGFPRSLIDDMRIELPVPSDMFEKRRLDLEMQKAGVVSQVLALQLFSKKHIYKDFYDMTDKEIEKTEKEVEEDIEKQMEQQMQAGMMDPAMGGGMPPPPMGGGMAPPMGGEAPVEGGPEFGGEPMENKPPTESTEVDTLMKLRQKLIIESTEGGVPSDTIGILTRRIARIKAKLRN
tara:strand:- start:8315 stop:10186 length:1872 start_codon:yes stop_codon:yes gene_type:complete